MAEDNEMDETEAPLERLVFPIPQARATQQEIMEAEGFVEMAARMGSVGMVGRHLYRMIAVAKWYEAVP